MSDSFNFTALCEYARSVGCEASKNAPLGDKTSFKIGGECGALIMPNSQDALSEVLKYLLKNEILYIILGNGSNVLAPDGFFDKAVIRLCGGLTELKMLDDTTVYCGAGVKLITLCSFALENSLSGLEFAYGIPASLGGAVFMNAGAYGGEMKNVVISVDCLTTDGKKVTVDAENAEFGYRTSAFKRNGLIITGATVRLENGDADEIKSKMNELMQRRKDKQPLDYPSAGSTFKRPDGYFAGALIEQCNLKGFGVGGAEVSEKHAGFVINKGNATSEDVKALIEKIQATVKEQTGVELEPEVIIL